MRSVLVVEDDPVSAMIMQRIVGKHFDVTVVNNGTDCEKACRVNIFDFILLDINLGINSLDGMVILDRLKTLEGCSKSIYAAMTAFAMPGDKKKYKTMGFDLYFPKPIDFDKLISTLRSFGKENAVGDDS